MATFVGNLFNDTITPTTVSAGVAVFPFGATPGLGADVLLGGGGNDTLNGGGGADFADGGAGDDLIFAVLGIDSAVGGSGVDTLNTTLFGGDYRVDLTTGLTNFAGESFTEFENLITGAGDDTLIGSAASNRLDGGAGNDSLYGGAGFVADTLIGGSGADTLNGGGGADFQDGGSGDDLVFASIGIDRAVGGSGVDTLNTTSFGGNYTVNLATGLTNFAGESYTGFENLVSGAGADLLTGTAGANRIEGGGGADRIVGTAGNDANIGGAGVDVMDYSALGTAVTLKSGGVVSKGALGNDTLGQFNVGAGTIETFETVIGAAGQRNVIDGTSVQGAVNVNVNLGINSFSSTVVVPFGGFAAGTTFGFQVQNFVDVLGTNNNDTITGNGLGNLLTGAGGVDVLNGAGGADTLRGGAGADVLTGGAGPDTFDFDAVSDSTLALRDVIVGFDGAGAAFGDLIDLSGVDALPFGGDQAFTFGAAGPGGLWLQNGAGGETLVFGNTDFDAAAEFAIRIQDGAVLASAYSAADFVL